MLALASSTPGIGFELTLNYGTTAAAYRNDTTIPIAKIEGGPDYKAEMRRLLQEALIPVRDPSLFAGTISVILSCLQFLNLIERPTKESPLKGMLKALKLSTEVFLEREIQTVEIALPVTRPYSTKIDTQTRNLDSILSSIGLSRMNEQPTRSSVATCYANNISSLPDTSSPGFIFSIDYSRSALILTLENLEIGLLEVTKTAVRFDLGADPLSRGYWRLMEIEMLKIVHRVNVRTVVVSGDRAWEQLGMLDVVKSVVGKKVLKGKYLGIGGGGVDPVWAGAFGVAKMAVDDVYEESDFGTRFTHDGHSYSRHELFPKFEVKFPPQIYINWREDRVCLMHPRALQEYITVDGSETEDTNRIENFLAKCNRKNLRSLALDTQVRGEIDFWSRASKITPWPPFTDVVPRGGYLEELIIFWDNDWEVPHDHVNYVNPRFGFRFEEVGEDRERKVCRFLKASKNKCLERLANNEEAKVTVDDLAGSLNIRLSVVGRRDASSSLNLQSY
ncbi:hypothetical protein IFR05_005899 [Cadophora sp. M221]|nr:hypothetical protein IFR05_005899 [Cadophora sp. M221]